MVRTRRLWIVLLAGAASSTSALLSGPVRNTPLKAEGEAGPQSLAHANVTHELSEEHALPRPNAGGRPDVIQFTVLCKAFFSLDVGKGSFSIDVVLSYSWPDPRVVKLIPAGQKSASLPSNTPPSKLWSPALDVTSREKDGIEYLMDYIQVNADGTVLRVQRMLLTNKNVFDTALYPFDRQTLTVLIASASSMMDDVVLEPVPNTTVSSMVKPDAFNGKPFDVVDARVSEFKEISGPLRKSRGKFDIVIERKWLGPMRSLSYPQVLLLFESYSVFFLPLAQFAVMPRVTTCLVAFLTLMGVQTGQAAVVPPPAGPNFLDLFNGTVMQLVIAALILNVFVHFVAFVWKDEPFAQEINHELRFGWAILAVVTMGTCACGSYGIGLRELSVCNQLGIWVYNIGYMFWCSQRHKARLAKQQEQQ